jgi:hypothetical protein
MSRAGANKYMKERRARLRSEGICVDCQKRDAYKDPKTGKQHTCCETCLKARRERVAANKRQYSLALEYVENVNRVDRVLMQLPQRHGGLR